MRGIERILETVERVFDHERAHGDQRTFVERREYGFGDARRVFDSDDLGCEEVSKTCRQRSIFWHSWVFFSLQADVERLDEGNDSFVGSDQIEERSESTVGSNFGRFEQVTTGEGAESFRDVKGFRLWIRLSELDDHFEQFEGKGSEVI